MTDPRFVIVGGGPAAAQAARSYRESGGTGPVTMLSLDDRAPYERPPLSKEYLRGEVDDTEQIEDDDFYVEHDIDLRLATTVRRLDLAQRRVHTDDGAVDYDVLLLATGAEPKPLPVDGADDPRVRVLRLYADGSGLRAAAAEAKRAVVCGSGFIGCETAASLAMRGIDVVQVSPEDLPLVARLGHDAAERIAGWLRDLGVDLRLATSVDGVAADGVRLSDGTTVPADLVVAAVGVRPRGELAEDAGLEVSDGRVVVDDHLRSSDPNVYAAGDVARAANRAAGRHLAVEHWGDALTMGEIAGTNAAGGDASWDSPPGFWSTIGTHTLKYSAWGDGFETVRVVPHADGAFTIWYGRDGATVGVLTNDADADYDQGTVLVRDGDPLPVV